MPSKLVSVLFPESSEVKFTPVLGVWTGGFSTHDLQRTPGIIARGSPNDELAVQC